MNPFGRAARGFVAEKNLKVRREEDAFLNFLTTNLYGCIVNKAPSGVLNLPNYINTVSLNTYIKETKTEMGHVKWPTLKEALAYTLIVIALCIILAALLGFFDYVFGLLIQKIIS
jgi:preprotein translocase SecE subunit